MSHNFTECTLQLKEISRRAKIWYKDNNADEYHRTQAYFFEQNGNAPRILFEEFLNKKAVVHSWNKPLNIFDVGCGPGRDMVYFSSKGFNITGIDISKRMVEIANKYYNQKAFLIDFANDDLSHLGVFHGLWACFSLLHINREDFPNILKKLSRLLEPNGIFAISLKERVDENLVPTQGTQSGGNTLEGEERFFSFWSFSEILCMVKKLKYEILSVYRNLPETNGRKEYGYIFLILQNI